MSEVPSGAVDMGPAGSSVTNYGGLFSAGASLLSGFGAYQSGQISAKGFEASAQSYAAGAEYANLNAMLEQESTNLQEFSEQRLMAKTTGSQQAVEAANGFGPGGSALSLTRETQLQGGLAEGMINAQGGINENSYLAEEQALLGEQASANSAASAAKSSGSMGMMGGILGAVGQIIGMF